MEQHRAAARARRDRAAPRRAVVDLVPDGRRGVVAAARTRARRARGRPRGRRLRVQPAAARGLSRPELGRREGARHAAQHRRGAEAALAHGAQAYGHWSGCHAIQWDADAPPTGDREITNRFSRQSYPVGIVVNRRGERFLDEGEDFRNYTYAKFGAEVLEQPRRHRGAGLRRATVGLLRTIDYEAPGAARVDAPTRSASSPTGSASTARASSARSRRSTPRSGRRVRPVGQGRQAHRGHRAAEVELGAADRRAAVHRLPHHVRDHVHVRRRARRRRRARARRAAGGRSPA